MRWRKIWYVIFHEAVLIEARRCFTEKTSKSILTHIYHNHKELFICDCIVYWPNWMWNCLLTMKDNSLLKRSWNPASLQLFDNSYYLRFDISLLMIHAIWVSNIKYADVNEQTGGINNNENFQLSNGIGDVRVYEW